jgi:hypothetical protein
MRKIVLLSAFMMSVVFSHAQVMRMGLNASPQFSWLKSDAAEVNNGGAGFGFSFGLQSDFFFAERYSFSTGLFINNTSAWLDYDGPITFKANQKDYIMTSGASIKYRIQYIDLPLVFRMESNQIGYFVYYGQFGVTNHFRVGSSANITSPNIEDVHGVGCKDEVNFYNMGYNVGAGVNYYFSKNTALTFGIIYTNGFIDVTTNESVSDNAYLRTLTLKVGVLF